ncbi:MAG: 30S ribosomal protein S12 methylthiotransferase RimO [Oscillospiraceae bacterium]|nr:30S ribosomal protein S12 methylthiotransferase RimO [Oscillospiraceae bacterium]
MTIGIVSLGCAKNLVNTEQMMYLLTQAGYTVLGETENVDAVIVNTCGFIDSAKMEAIDTIIELGKARDRGDFKKLIVTGCLSERYKTEMLDEMPEVDAVVGVGSFEDIVETVEAVLAGADRVAKFGDINTPVSETKRIITTSHAWAYIKVAEGCDNRCAFCIIPQLRGKFRSRPIEAIVEEAKALAAHGIKELILVAQDTTRYGLDLYGRHRLSELLNALCAIEEFKWIRLHYLYPDAISDELIDTIASNDKILNYVDMPIQHISDDVLVKMNRRGNGAEVRALIKKLRDRIAGVVIRTSIIAGLPGEGETEFEELCQFLRSTKIERAGVFKYSPEEGTAAALMERPDSDIAQDRADYLRDIQSQVIDAFNDDRIGTVTTVLIEGVQQGRYYGRSYAESPDVDGYITVLGEKMKTNEFYDVRIIDIIDGEPVGEIV